MSDVFIHIKLDEFSSSLLMLSTPWFVLGGQRTMGFSELFAKIRSAAAGNKVNECSLCAKTMIQN